MSFIVVYHYYFYHYHLITSLIGLGALIGSLFAEEEPYEVKQPFLKLVNATVILVISSRGFVRPPNMKKAWLYRASFIVYPSGKHVFCVQVECDCYVVNVLSVLNISKWPFQWFLAVQNNRKHPLPTPFAPKKMQT